MPLDLTRLSRTVSHALRHEPWLYELELDEQGWTPVEALLAPLREQHPSWAGLSERDLVAMMAASSKQRFELAGGRIRALYGHSLPERLAKQRAVPPAQLFHGTAPAALAAIRRNGLLPMRRQYVHLSTSRDEAVAVGQRKAARPVILSVRAREAADSGLPFYSGNARVWLADRVPWAFIDAPSG